MEELQDLEAQEIASGPFAALSTAMKTRSQVLISCRNNKKLLARVKAYDRHFNMVLEEVREIWTDSSSRSKKKAGKKTSPLNKERFINKMFLRGDSVILVVLAPPPQPDNLQQ